MGNHPGSTTNFEEAILGFNSTVVINEEGAIESGAI